MRYYIGIDGGGSKTRFACVDENGRIVAEHVCGSTFYRQLGMDAVEETLRQGVYTLIEKMGAQPEAISFGMPGYGEAMQEDEMFVRRLQETFAPVPFFAENDVAMAFYGAFTGASGILLVAGTGSMAWGRDDKNNEKRCGGWSHHFGDEGSGYWVGKRAMELFSKESDGRRPKTLFHSMLRKHLKLADWADDLSAVAELEGLFEQRGEVAAVHRVLHEAAIQGDAEAARIYEEAARELADIVSAMERQMYFEDKVPVSYMGGMFNCEHFVLEPVKAMVEASFNADFHPPKAGPCLGAALYAALKLGDEQAFCALREGIKEFGG